MNLTKEVIQELGWEHKGGFWYEWPIKNEIYCEEFSSRCLDFRLNFVSYDRYLTIEAYERNSFDWETCFRMPCHTKEDLQWVMNKLNINATKKEQ